ncbi:MAG: hypothetical protein U5M51_06775 [Emticicia sp.]|nr:hypothetical protein [Emticicia sp.]
MQKTFLTLLLALFLTNIFGQKTEFKLTLNSGLFSFNGQSSDKNSQINFSNLTNSGYTNNPYGSMRGICYGLSGNLKRVTKKNLDIGLDLGFETLRSKVNITSINDYIGTSTYEYTASGQTFLNSNFINLFPYIGQRFNIRKLSLDIVGGLEIAYCLTATEKGDATATNGTKYTTSVDRKTINTDIRPRIQFSADYKKTGIYIGYSYGLANYKSGYEGGTNECYARLIRFGLTYRLK